ncbi:hypothetical protein E4U10_002681 [Claviceps purpurea]|nr:hypothetical protein E4U10_002681 [Claviceps purpurea]KAG6285538.1 hypothetical protein E4U45_000322 [Claviceps purpurea]
MKEYRVYKSCLKLSVLHLRALDKNHHLSSLILPDHSTLHELPFTLLLCSTDHIMKICILVASLLYLGASALPEAEESITVGGHTYKGGDLPKGELKVHALPESNFESRDPFWDLAFPPPRRLLSPSPETHTPLTRY